ncbi:MAG: hypothetical protein ACTSVI_13660 [Promethearchaeota archaeon]
MNEVINYNNNLITRPNRLNGDHHDADPLRSRMIREAKSLKP